MNDVFAGMLGMWSGEGCGVFPTIDAFVYRETLTIERRDEMSLFFVQKSVRTTSAGTWVASHWESGFIRQLDSDTLDLACAQSGGRTEVLRGTVTASGPRLVVDFVSTAISNDPRVVATARRWDVEGDTFRYSMDMRTTRVTQLAPHLSAALRRDRV